MAAVLLVNLCLTFEPTCMVVSVLTIHLQFYSLSLKKDSMCLLLFLENINNCAGRLISLVCVHFQTLLQACREIVSTITSLS